MHRKNAKLYQDRNLTVPHPIDLYKKPLTSTPNILPDRSGRVANDVYLLISRGRLRIPIWFRYGEDFYHFLRLSPVAFKNDYSVIGAT